MSALKTKKNAAVNFDTYRILQEVDNGTFMYAKHGNLVDADASGAKTRCTRSPTLGSARA